MTIIHKSADGSVCNASGRIQFFSVKRFISDICQGNCCFICGKSPSEVPFNDEHVLPKWLLKRYSLFDKKINLPNNVGLTYDRWTIPCCVACNDQMGEEIESPISLLIDKGYDAVVDHLATEGPWTFFRWFNLIFIKTHLKGKSLRWHLDSKMGNTPISDLYEWEELHHIHCVARTFHTGINLAPPALGSIMVMPAKQLDWCEAFDYCDLYEPKTIMLKLGEVAFVVVLKDSCAAFNVLQDFMARINGRLSPIQLRELAAHAANVYLHLTQFPKFYTSFAQEPFEIRASHPPTCALHPIDSLVQGALIDKCCGSLIDDLKVPFPNEIRESMREGKRTFLFDDAGNFIRDSMEWQGMINGGRQSSESPAQT